MHRVQPGLDQGLTNSNVEMWVSPSNPISRFTDDATVCREQHRACLGHASARCVVRESGHAFSPCLNSEE